MRKLCLLVALCSMLLGTAHAAFFKKKIKPAPPRTPRLLAVPFQCDNQEICEKINESFLEEITRKNLVVYNLKGFALDVASAAKAAVSTSTETAKPKPTEKELAALPGLESKPEATPVIANEPQISTETTAPPQDSSPPKPPEPELPKLTSFAEAELTRMLPRDGKLRRRFYEEGHVDYLVVGKARERKLSDLEAENLKTAETAEMRLYLLETDELLAEESFIQGRFEVVSPERIGRKFANLVNDKIAGLRKEKKRLDKEAKKKR